MIRSYIKLALRNLWKRKAFTFINIMGLSLGFAACLAIWRYVDFEFSYDNFHRQSHSIHKAVFTEYGKNIATDWSDHFGFGLGPTMVEEIPEVEEFVRIHPLYGDRALISTSGEAGREPIVFAEENIFFADPSFFHVFEFEFQRGSAMTALSDPGSMVMTSQMASKYFGDADPVGKVVHLSTLYWGARSYTVTGVLHDVPQNSSLQFDFLLSMHDLLQIDYYREEGAGWTALNFVTYLKLGEQATPATLEAKTKAFMDKHTGTEPAGVTLSYQPLRQINLSPDLNVPGGHRKSLYFLVVVSVIVLSIAFINFVNLATARAGERSKEVGIRKAIGVSRSELVKQFMVEAVVTNFLSMTLAYFLALAAIPVLSLLVSKAIPMDITDPHLWGMLVALFLCGSLISGLHPAYLLSSFRVADAMKNKGVTSRSGAGHLRQVLVVFQFTASLLLIIATLVIYRQMRYMQDHDKGMSMKKMLVVNGPQISTEEDRVQRMATFKNELLKMTSIQHVTTSGKIPGAGYNFTAGVEVVGREKEGAYREPIHVVWADKDFTAAYQMRFLSGQNWNPNSHDEMSVLINEAAVAKFALGTPEEALRKQIRINGSEPLAIHGVIRNFNWSSLKSPYEPMIFRPRPANYNIFSIHLAGDVHPALEQIEQLYKAHFAGSPFVYRFLDDFFANQYNEERQFERLFGVFSVLACVIACLGLLGLAAFVTFQRRKEIGIRKVMGATIRNIIALLSSQFVRLFSIGAIVSIPVFWYAAQRWLSGFAFHINLTTDLYLLPLGLLLMICTLTISAVIVGGANVNSAEVLRSE